MNTFQDLLLQSIQEIIFAVETSGDDLLGSVRFASRRAEKVLGCSPNEFVENPDLFLSLIHPEDIPHVKKDTRNMFETGKPVTRTYRIRPKTSGEYLWFQDRPSPLLDAGGKMIGYVAVAYDITGQKKSERARAELNARLTDTLESMGDAFVSLDKNWYYTYVNRHAAAIFNRTPEDLIGKHIWTEFPEGVGQPFYKNYHKVMETRQPMVMEEHYPPYDRWFENRIYPTEEGISIFFTDVTDRKKIEIALRESDRFNRLLFQSSTIGLALARMDGTLVQVNSTYAAIIGHSIPETLELTYWDITPAKYSDQEQAQRESLRTTGRYGPYEKEYIHKDGHLVPVRLSGLIIERGGEQFIWSSVEDITASKRAEEELNQNRTFIESIINASPDIIYIYDIEARKNVYVNEGIQHILGYTDQETKAMGSDLISTLMHPDDFVEYLRDTVPRYSTASGSELIEHEYRMRTKNGVWRWLHSKESIFVRNEDGTPKQIFGIVEDITESMKTGEALKERENLLSAVGRMAKVGGWEFDTATLKGTWTDEVARIHDLQPGQETNAEIGLSFYHGESREKILQAIKEAIELAKPYDLELEMVTAAGRRKWVRTIGEPVKSNDKVVKLRGSFQDITELKQSEEKVRKLNAELELRVAQRTAQLAAVNKDLESFSYSVSHDLRAPLRAVTGFAQIVARRHRANLNEEGRHYVDNIVQAGERMGQLIDDLLTYSRLGRQSVRLEHVSLQDLFGHLAVGLTARVQQIGGTMEIADDLPSVLGTRTLLGQIFTNLLENALIYRKPDVPARVAVTWQSEGKTVIIRVSDNGIGIPAEHHEKIFNVFQRLHSEDVYPGTGVGLATVKKAVELLGGTVRLESIVGEGSTFLIELRKE